MPVVVEAREADSMTGRLLLQAPDVDGIAFIKGDCAVGQIRTGVVTGTTDYDVVVELGAALFMRGGFDGSAGGGGAEPR